MGSTVASEQPGTSAEANAPCSARCASPFIAQALMTTPYRLLEPVLLILHIIFVTTDSARPTLPPIL